MANTSTILYATDSTFAENVDLSTFTQTGSALSFSSGGGNYFKGLCVDRNGSYVYLVDAANKRIVKVTASSFTVLATLTMPSYPQAIVIDSTSTYAYVLIPGSSEIVKIDLSTFALVGTALALPNAFSYGLAIDTNDSFLYVTYQPSGLSYLSKIDLSTFSIVGSPLTLTSGNGAAGIVIDPASAYAYVANNASNNVSKVDLASFTWVANVAVGASPIGIAIDPSGTYLYVGNTGASTVTKIALSSFTTVGTALALAGSPNDLAVDSLGGYLYVGRTNSSIDKISLSSFTVSSTLVLTVYTPKSIVIFTPFASAPSAPTLSAPANASFQDVSSGQTFSAVYNSTDTENQNAYAMRIKVSGGSYLYYNAGTNALQSTIVWNTDNIAPGATFSATLPNTAISDGNIYNWSFASQESFSNLQGVFASDFTFTASAPPTTTVTAPTGNIASNSPVVTWTDALSGSTQADYEVKVESGTFATTPGSGTAVWDSGVVASAATNVTIGVTLTNTVTYRAFVQVTNSGGQVSAWGYTTFTVTVDAPATPTLTALATTDPTTGAPMVQLTLQGNDNGLTTVQASLEGGLTTGWTAGANTTIASSATWSQDGSYSLAMTATAAGAATALTPIGTSGVSVVAGSTVRAMAFFHSATTARACDVTLSFYNAAGTLLSTVTSASVNSTLTGSGTGAQAFVTATVPVGAVTASLTLNGAALGAGEVLYADSMLIAPGNSTAWTRGGLVGITTATITRSDGQLVRGAGWDNVALIPQSQSLVINDYECAPGTSYTYSATVSASVSLLVITSPPSAPTASVETSSASFAWLIDLTAPAGALGFAMTQNWQPLVKEMGQVTYPIGLGSGVKTTDGTKGMGGIIPINAYTPANGLKAQALINSTATLLLVTPQRGIFYVTGDPQMDRRANIVFAWEATANQQTEWAFSVIAVGRP